MFVELSRGIPEQDERDKGRTGRFTPDHGEEVTRLVRDTVERLRLARELLDGLGEDEKDWALRHLEGLEEILENALHRLKGERPGLEESPVE